MRWNCLTLLPSSLSLGHLHRFYDTSKKKGSTGCLNTILTSFSHFVLANAFCSCSHSNNFLCNWKKKLYYLNKLWPKHCSHEVIGVNTGHCVKGKIQGGMPYHIPERKQYLTSPRKGLWPIAGALTHVWRTGLHPATLADDSSNL